MPKLRPFERSYRATTPPKKVVNLHLSNKTKIGRTAGRVYLNCDNCGLGIEQWACVAKLHARHFCSNACVGEAARIPVKVICAQCSRDYISTPSRTKDRGYQGRRSVTCSPLCAKIYAKERLLKEAQNMSQSKFFRYGNHEKGIELAKKLTEDKAEQIRRDRRTQKVIAKDFNISQSMVSLIKNNKVWR